MRLLILILLIPFLAHAESTSGEVKAFEILHAKKRHCVFAPEAKTEEEKRATLIAAAKSFIENGKKSDSAAELCMAFVRPTSTKPHHHLSSINSYSFPGGGAESVAPGKVSWAMKDGEYVFSVSIGEGYEGADAYQYVSLMIDYLNGEGCTVEDEIEGCLADLAIVKSLIHKELRIKDHPLDKLLGE
jgi:hypothetical protein